MTTTVRVSYETKKMAEALSARYGKKLVEIFNEAVELYRRHRFLEEVNAAFAALRANEKEWNEERREREAWDVTLGDGLEND